MSVPLTENERKAFIVLSASKLLASKEFTDYFQARVRDMMEARAKLALDLSTKGESLERARIEHAMLKEVLDFPKRDYEMNRRDLDEV